LVFDFPKRLFPWRLSPKRCFLNVAAQAVISTACMQPPFGFPGRSHRSAKYSAWFAALPIRFLYFSTNVPPAR
jgi:hypothetical protein